MSADYRYQADDICQSYLCGSCGEEIHFSNYARLEMVKKALEAHECKKVHEV